MDDALWALWLFLPAAIANGTPVIVNKIPGAAGWNTPLDFNAKYKGQRIFGDHKTWRGLVSGVIAGSLAAYVQYLLSDHGQTAFAWVLGGALLGFGALYGDAAESFLKRQRGVPSGERWFPFDQIDYIIGGLLAVALLGLFRWWQVPLIIISYFVVHLVATWVGYQLKLRDRPL